MVNAQDDHKSQQDTAEFTALPTNNNTVAFVFKCEFPNRKSKLNFVNFAFHIV